MERLWSALCSWNSNLRITLNYLARLTCASGNVAVMVQQAKRIMVSFSCSRASAIVAELIKDLQVQCLTVYVTVLSGCVCALLQSVEILSVDLQPSESPPFYCLVGSQSQAVVERGGEGNGGNGWAGQWRAAVRGKEAGAVALPTPARKQHYASLQSVLKLPVRQLVPLHRYSHILCAGSASDPPLCYLLGATLL